MKWQKDKSDILTSGDTFEKYTIVKLLGKGGMGAVYLVRHNILDSFFALKVLFPDVANKNRQFVDRFIREAKLACKIKHPNLIAVHDAGQNKENGMYYLIMDYVSGGNIRDLLKSQGKIRQDKAIIIVEQIASALDEAYKYKMVHRDIKPDNIMFTDNGIAKLADLGIAKSANEQDTMLTIDASVFGTPAYMSPEQALDSSKVDCRADIYSLGIVFFEMLTGRRPYHGNSTIEILSQVVKDVDIPDVRELCPEISENVALLIQDMTAKQLEHRIATPAELLKRLHDIGSPEVDSDILSNNIIDSSDESTVTLPTLSGESFAVHTMPTIVSASADDCLPQTVPTLVNTEVSSNNCKNNTCVTREINSTGKIAATPDTSVNAADEPSGITDTQQTATSILTENTSMQQSTKSAFSKWITNNKKFILAIIAAATVISIAIGFMISIQKTQEQLPGKSAHQPEKQVSPVSSPAQAKTLPKYAEISSLNDKSSPKNVDKPEFSSTTFEVSEKKDNRDSQIGNGKLIPEAIVILGHLENKYSAGDKSIFLEAETFSRYRQQLREVIQAKPKCVILIPSARYADLNVSIANFENLIREEADMLRDNTIPFMFVLSQTNTESPKIEKFNSALKEFCNLKSIPLLSSEKDILKETRAFLNPQN